METKMLATPPQKTRLTAPEKPSFREAFLFWLKLGFISFGGPAGQIGIMHTFIVEQKRWVSDSRFLHALNYCMLLPGPEAQQLATYLGWLMHGVRGGLVAGIFFVLPSVFILLGLSSVYVSYGTIPWVAALFYGLKPAVVAIVALALLKIAGKSLKTWFHYLLAVLSFVAIFFLKIPFPLIILATIVLAIVLRKLTPNLFQEKEATQKQAEDEESYYLHAGSEVVGAGVTWGKSLLRLGVTLLLWVVPLGLFYLFTREFPFWSHLVAFFTKAALVTFGGAYAVLPYVAQVAVEKFEWLSRYQMIDGLALGETTPGPLIMVLTFVGFMAGFNHYGGSLAMGALGLFTTTFYTFLPCFFFILAGAPLIERTRGNAAVKSILGVVTAAVVGVVLNLTVYFGVAVLFPEGLSLSRLDYFALVWMVISFLAMYRFKVGMMLWIGISAMAGLAHYLLFSATF
ncbi:chromate efflux transporter [Rufibacter latericius]|uniref:Chromate efflux transporter n=1 Tax=Rufibacter latericius TaxID=2487040 RepID=A0A3M9N1Z7_9BACT|nr:chromate efflux transporter [Rufibacter latericius]RNI31058.1 chromate efflux transporter [Rufibacter latericius]